MTKYLRSIAFLTLLKELRDASKATSDHLSSIKGKASRENTSIGYHQTGLRKIAVNNTAKSSFGGTKRQLQHFGHILLPNAGEVYQVRRNGDLSHGFEKKSRRKHKKERKLGCFHLLSDEMKNSRLKVCREDTAKARIHDQNSRLSQRKEKQRKVELLRKHKINNVNELFVDALNYHEMYNSLSCLRKIISVDRELRTLNSKTAKLNRLK